MHVICGISAWQYHATPPVFLSTPCPHEGINGPEPTRAFRSRANAAPASTSVIGRLAYDLKSVSLPIHIMTDEDGSLRRNRNVMPRRMARDINPRRDLISLGNDLYVLSIERTLLDLAKEEPYASVLLRCLEACGIYAVSNETSRSRDATLTYVQAYQEARKNGQAPRAIVALTDERGRVPLVDLSGEPAAWTPCVDLRGRFDSLWKRPPLTTREDLLTFCGQKHGATGIKTLRKAAEATRDGSASPLESRLFPLLTLPPHQGGEGWPAPLLNHRIMLPDALARATGQQSCTADLLFAEARGIIEVQSRRYHSDALGFNRRNGRNAALEALGYRITEITYDQMRDLEVFDMRIEAIAHLFGLPLKSRTAAFLRHRDELHEGLFS